MDLGADSGVDRLWIYPVCLDRPWIDSGSTLYAWIDRGSNLERPVPYEPERGILDQVGSNTKLIVLAFCVTADAVQVGTLLHEGHGKRVPTKHERSNQCILPVS